MKILYITTPGEEYLEDQILIGLRRKFGANCVDYPRKDQVYERSFTIKKRLYGHGFTVWNSLPEIKIDRTNIPSRIQKREFDLIIFGSAWRQLDVFKIFIKNKIFAKKKARFCFLDGEDYPDTFSECISIGTYFKRELEPSAPEGALPIGFSIPSEKIRETPLGKIKRFALHVQCEEAYKIKEIKKHCRKHYAFKDERHYYDDIARSKYAITMRKGGWECMRHLEIAANHTVPCFYKLSEKPETGAPHGLTDMKNAIAFNTADELQKKIAHVESAGLYGKLQNEAAAWARQNTCEAAAARVVEAS